jgi:hypothetical protein
MCLASRAYPGVHTHTLNFPACEQMAAAGSSMTNPSHTEAPVTQSNAADTVSGTAYAVADATSALSRADVGLSVDKRHVVMCAIHDAFGTCRRSGSAPIRSGAPRACPNARTIRLEEADAHSSAAGIRVEALRNSSEVFALQVECAHHDFEAVMIGLGAEAIPSPDLQIQVGGKTNAIIRARMAALRGRHRDFGVRIDSVLGRIVPVPRTYKEEASCFGCSLYYRSRMLRTI